jgi:hypothetical protein
MKRWQTRIMLLAGLAIAGCFAPSMTHAAWKVGLDEVQLSGAKYTHDDSVNTVTVTNSDGMVGTDLAVEWLPSEHIGFEIDTSLSPLERNYKLGTAGAISTNVTEKASYTLYGANLYVTRNNVRGIQPLFGVSTGQIAVSQAFSVGNGTGALAAINTSATVDINILKFGFDWLTDFGVFRLQYQQWTGAAANATKLTGVRQVNDYTGSAIALGAFAYF